MERQVRHTRVDGEGLGGGEADGDTFIGPMESSKNSGLAGMEEKGRRTRESRDSGTASKGMRREGGTGGGRATDQLVHVLKVHAEGAREEDDGGGQERGEGEGVEGAVHHVLLRAPSAAPAPAGPDSEPESAATRTSRSAGGTPGALPPGSESESGPGRSP
jgi:hypothetical protein